MSNVIVFLTVRDRSKSTFRCLQSLFETARGRVDVFVFDNASAPELSALWATYKIFIDFGLIKSLVVNRPGSMPGAEKFSKPWAFRQMMLMMSMFPPDQAEYMLQIDNDVYVEDGWLDACIEVLESGPAQASKIKVVSAWNGPPRYDTIKTIPAAGRQIEVRDAVGGAFWFARVDHWRSMRPPIANWYDDCQLWDQMKKKGQRFGVIVPPLAHDAPDSGYSARLRYGEGEFTDEDREAFEKARKEIEIPKPPKQPEPGMMITGRNPPTKHGF